VGADVVGEPALLDSGTAPGPGVLDESTTSPWVRMSPGGR